MAKIGSLPEEILDHILQETVFVRDELNVHFFVREWQDEQRYTRKDLAQAWFVSLPTRRSLPLVCKPWYRLGIPLLHRTLLLGVRTSPLILVTLVARPELGHLVQRVSYWAYNFFRREDDRSYGPLYAELIQRCPNLLIFDGALEAKVSRIPSYLSISSLPSLKTLNFYLPPSEPGLPPLQDLLLRVARVSNHLVSLGFAVIYNKDIVNLSVISGLVLPAP